MWNELAVMLFYYTDARSHLLCQNCWWDVVFNHMDSVKVAQWVKYALMVTSGWSHAGDVIYLDTAESFYLKSLVRTYCAVWIHIHQYEREAIHQKNIWISHQICFECVLGRWLFYGAQPVVCFPFCRLKLFVGMLCFRGQYTNHYSFTLIQPFQHRDELQCWQVLIHNHAIIRDS